MAIGRIPTGGINITYCKQVERSSIPGPSNQVPLNVASGDNTPMSGRTVPYGGSGRKPNRDPSDGNQEITVMGDLEGGMMVMIMEMIMMIHPSRHLHQRPKSIRRRTRRRRQVVAEEGETMTQGKILTTVMKSLSDV